MDEGREEVGSLGGGGSLGVDLGSSLVGQCSEVEVLEVLEMRGGGVSVNESGEEVGSLGGRSSLGVNVGTGLVGQSTEIEVFKVLEHFCFLIN